MPRPLKVFGYTGYRRDAHKDRNVHGQTREIIAARSKTEAQRMSGLTRTRFDHSASITGNDEEIAQAMSAPGTVFWQPHNYPARTGEWVAVPPAANA